MKTLGNILWHFPFLGFITATAVYLLGLLFTVTVVGAPVGLGLMELGKFLFWPFGRSMVSKSGLNVEQNQAWKAYSTIVMILYFPFGLFLALVVTIQIAALFISIIGIPAALVLAKSLGTYFNPVNKICVSGAVATELEKRKGQAEVEKYLNPDNNKKPLETAPTQITEVQQQSAAQPKPPQFATAASALPAASPSPSWLIPAVAGAVILVLVAGGFIYYFQKTQREAGLREQRLQQLLAAEQERTRQQEADAQRLAMQAAANEKMIRAEEERRATEMPDRAAPPASSKAIANFMIKHGLSMSESISKDCNFDFKTQGNPYFIAGDFDGDGRIDYAISVNKSMDYGHGYVFLANGQIHDLGGVGDLIMNDEKGRTIHSYEGNITPKYDSIRGVYCGKSSYSYVYNENKSKFYKFTTGG